MSDDIRDARLLLIGLSVGLVLGAVIFGLNPWLFWDVVGVL